MVDGERFSFSAIAEKLNPNAKNFSINVLSVNVICLLIIFPFLLSDSN